MSRSSLWIMSDKFEGFEVEEFKNSWLFSPIVWSVLLDKYMAEEIKTPYGYKKNFFTDSSLFNPLNEKINNCNCTPDRVCWEMSNQQIFFTKDKHVVAKNIQEFLMLNSNFNESNDGLYPLKQEHIIERFVKISKSILELDENETPYFILKNTSCDDNVESWFGKYDKETKEYIDIDLSKQDKFVAEFVIVKDGKIDSFISNLDYFKN